MSDGKNTPIWKKEISFRRKPEAAAPEGDAGSTPLWKKEVSFRKKSEAGTVETPVETPTDAVSEVAVEDADVAVDLDLIARYAGLPAAPPPPAEEPPSEHDWLTKPLEEVSEPPAEPLALVPAPELEDTPAPIALVPPAVEAPVDVDDVAPQVEPATPDTPVLPEPAQFDELDLELDLDLPATAAPELPPLRSRRSWRAASPCRSFLRRSRQPWSLSPTSRALELGPEPAPDEAPAKVPFYKKEFSLKRGPREPKEKAERKPKEPKAKKEPKPKKERKPKLARRAKAVAEVSEAEGTPAEQTTVAPAKVASNKVPFYKRDFSFKRSSKEWDDAEPAPSKPKMRRLPRPKPSLSKASLPGSSSKKIVGLKIGGSQIAAARINNGSTPELVQIVRGPLDHGIVVGGELRDPEALAVALRDFFKRHNLPKRGIRLGIANNRIGVRTFEVTGIADPKQLGNAIRFRAQEVLPIPLEEAVLDYQVLSEGVTEDGQPFSRVLLVVAYRELVDRYVHACEKAGLQIVGIDLEAFALLRAVAEPHDPLQNSERGALVAVSVGHDRSTFAVSDGRICEFTRVLEWGGWSLNVAIARALDISPTEAEPIKRTLSFVTPTTAPDGFGEEQFAAALEAARRQLQTFARELVSSLQYYQNQPGSLGISEIVLTGGTTHLIGLSAELERLIGVPVRVADPFARVTVSKKVGELEQSGSFAIAIGLGIED